MFSFGETISDYRHRQAFEHTVIALALFHFSKEALRAEIAAVVSACKGPIWTDPDFEPGY